MSEPLIGIVGTERGSQGVRSGHACRSTQIGALLVAVTDGTDQLRYPAGPYATELLAARAATDDATFIGGIKQQFGI